MEDLNKKVGKQIKTHRQIKEKTRKELGKEIGVCYQQVHHYETGVQNITIKRLFDISKALGVHFLQLLPNVLTGKKKDDKNMETYND